MPVFGGNTEFGMGEDQIWERDAEFGSERGEWSDLGGAVLDLDGGFPHLDVPDLGGGLQKRLRFFR